MVVGLSSYCVYRPVVLNLCETPAPVNSFFYTTRVLYRAAARRLRNTDLETTRLLVV
jgi:hypothetical protein